MTLQSLHDLTSLHISIILLDPIKEFKGRNLWKITQETNFFSPSQKHGNGQDRKKEIFVQRIISYLIIGYSFIHVSCLPDLCAFP